MSIKLNFHNHLSLLCNLHWLHCDLAKQHLPEEPKLSLHLPHLDLDHHLRVQDLEGRLHRVSVEAGVRDPGSRANHCNRSLHRLTVRHHNCRQLSDVRIGFNKLWLNIPSGLPTQASAAPPPDITCTSTLGRLLRLPAPPSPSHWRPAPPRPSGTSSSARSTATPATRLLRAVPCSSQGSQEAGATTAMCQGRPPPSIPRTRTSRCASGGRTATAPSDTSPPPPPPSPSPRRRTAPQLPPQASVAPPTATLTSSPSPGRSQSPNLYCSP